MSIMVVGIDAAFANMGFARAALTVHSNGSIGIECLGLALISTKPVDKSMKVRKSSDRLRRAHELRDALILACSGTTFAFIEVPSGTQNANAAMGLGIAVGVLASCPVPIIEVSPMEVKAAVAGRKVTKGASKAEVIAWAAARWPHAPWNRAGSRTKTLPSGRLTADNEHLADAMAAIVAGVATPEFRRLIQLSMTGSMVLNDVYLQNAVTYPHVQRPAPRRVALNGIPVEPVPMARRTVLR